MIPKSGYRFSEKIMLKQAATPKQNAQPLRAGRLHLRAQPKCGER